MKYQNLFSFQKHLQSASPDHLCPIYLVILEEDFERTKIMDEILHGFPPTEAPFRFRASEHSLSELLEELRTPSLFGTKTILFLDELEKLPLSSLKKIDPFLHSDFVFILGARSKKSLASLFPSIEKRGVILDLSQEKPWDKEKRFLELAKRKIGKGGKTISSEELSYFLSKLDPDLALIENELEKLILYGGDRKKIESSDIDAITSERKSFTFWQLSEEMVWQSHFQKPLPSSQPIDASFFHALCPTLRSQLQTGLQITSLLDQKASLNQISESLPRIWPKALEKKVSLSRRQGSAFFRKGLEHLFEIELASRNNITSYAALLDLFRAKTTRYLP